MDDIIEVTNEQFVGSLCYLISVALSTGEEKNVIDFLTANLAIATEEEEKE